MKFKNLILLLMVLAISATAQVKIHSSSESGGQQRGLGNFSPRGTGELGCASVHVETIWALRRACHRDRNQFAILPWDGTFIPAYGLVELDKGAENSAGASWLKSAMRFRSSES